MLADTVGTLATHPQIIGIKEACGDANRVGEIRERVADEFVILSGEDAQTLQMLDLGAVGTITVTANVAPALMAEFLNAYLGGDLERARELDAMLQPVHEILFREPSPTASKWALHLMGRIDIGIRLPLLPLSAGHHAELTARLQAIGALS